MAIHSITKSPNTFWMQIVITLAVIMAIILLFKYQNTAAFHEGFVQDKPFVSKTGTSVYDDFYVDIYDRLMECKKRADYEIAQVIQTTQPDTKYDTLLDIGSGTGHLVSLLQKKGFRVYGLDNSKAMVDYCEKHNPDALIKHGDALEPMMYEQGVFSHIFCMGFMVYHVDNKAQLFHNIYHWLRPGGYFIVHLIDPDKFDTIVPAGRPKMIKSPQNYVKRRIIKTNVDFIDFTYSGEYEFRKNETLFKETFVDGLTKNVRKNEIPLYMETRQNIIRAIMMTGFTSKGEFNMVPCNGDKYQYIYIFVK